MINLKNVTLRYLSGGKNINALDNINLHLPAGQFTVIVGQSGCGKSSLLRVLAGLQPASEGSIERTPAACSPAMIFQQPRLFPWLTVSKNITLGLNQGLIKHSLSKQQIATKLQAILQLIGLSDFHDAWPGQLSGGMMQRVSLARTLITEPQFLLMDEPFSALDALTRRILQGELIRCWQQLNNTIVFVTHDVEEAIFLGQQVIVMQQGKINKQLTISQTHPRQYDDLELISHKKALLDQLLATM